MKLGELMRELAVRLDLGEVALEDDGGAQVVVGDGLSIDIEYGETSGGIAFSATVGPAPADDMAAALSELLDANLLGQGTNGATLALDRVLGEIVLCRSIGQPEMAYEAFEAELTRFAEALQFWHRRVADGELGSALEEDGDDDASDSAPELIRV